MHRSDCQRAPLSLAESGGSFSIRFRLPCAGRFRLGQQMDNRLSLFFPLAVGRKKKQTSFAQDSCVFGERQRQCVGVFFPLPLPSIQRLLIFRKQLVVYCKQIHSVQNAVKDNGISPVLGIKLGKPALLQKLLRFLR